MAAKAPQDRRPKATPRRGVERGIEAIDFDALPEAPPVEEVHLFTLNGRDYYVPEEVPANVVLQYLDLARDEGEVAAGGWLLRKVLGDESYGALAAWDGLRQEHLAQLIEAVRRLSMGSVEATTRPLGR